LARVKQTITQRDFSLGAVREEFLDSDDMEMRQKSLRDARNVRVVSTRVIQSRPGTFLVREMPGATDIVEIQDDEGRAFGLVKAPGSLTIIDAEGTVVHEISQTPWSDGCELWTVPFRDETIIGTRCGTQGMWVLKGTPSGWTLDPFEFDARPGGEVAQPYWVYQKGITIRPEFTEGLVRIEASQPVFKAGHRLTRIRYGRREIEIRAVASSTVVFGQVITTLPPTFLIGVKNIKQFAEREAVVAADTNFQGVITRIIQTNPDNSGVMEVLTLEFFDGPDID
jgi:hypothetical protein